MTYHAPRGTSDILPEEQAYWRYVEQKAADICRLYGYRRIDTPAFEDTSLFYHGTGETTDIVEKEMYTFEDRGGNRLTLRPEGTPPVCRAYIEHGLHNQPQPVMLYYITPIFRYDRPQAGRYRQHHQFGCEAIGEANPALDAEVIDVAWQFFTALGLRHFSLQLNSIGCKKCRSGYLTSLTEHYNPHVDNLCPDCKTRLTRNPLRLLDCKKASCQQVAESAPNSIDHLCPECAEHFNTLKKHLGSIDIPFEVNHRLVRGLDYYTRTVFEIQPDEEKAQSTLCGGGRYDNLIEGLGGRSVPGIGFACGIERIILNLKKQAITVPPLPGVQVFIASLGDEAAEKALALAARLRQGGIGVINASGSRSLKAQLRQANKLNIPRAIIIGDEEIKTGTVILRDMTTSQQKTIPTTRLQEELRSK